MELITTTGIWPTPARVWRAIPSSPSIPNSCARPPITPCSAWRRWPRTDEAVVVDALAPGIDLAPFFALMADEKVVKVFHAARQDIEIVWHRPNMIPHPIFDTQVAAMVLGYGDSISYDQLVQRITGDTPRQVQPLHRLDAPSADAGAGHLRSLRRDPSARRLSQACPPISPSAAAPTGSTRR